MTLTIGPHAFEGTAVLAPLASVTSAPFRQICLEHGCSFAVTEMVASEALVRDARKSLRRTERAASERVLVVQLFGADPRVMAQAAALVVERSGASILDVNMGCPVRKILGGGAGVALMRDPERAEAIVREMIRAVDGRVPVTVKMRAGWDDESITAPELARRLEGAGVAAVCVHARTKEQVHSGRSRWEVIR
ncbi:MAG TPA: tRNA-dihydrouridine synthase family protein, partial [Polyangiaceae bacterium]|nr:tRNA-dihydrouridine synthase family protein [Polyangiaceae bacterium]